MDLNENEILARIILSTRRKRRPYSIFDIALDIKRLQEIKGSLDIVASQVGVSRGMLNQFLSVFKLPSSVIDRVKNRRIDSVSFVHNLSKFKEEDILKLNELMDHSNISSQDLKVLLPYRKQYPDEPIEDLITRIKLSQNRKVAVIRIPKQDVLGSEERLRNTISDIIGDSNLIDLVFSDEHIDLKLTKEGEQILRDISRLKGKTLMETIFDLY